MGRCLEEQQLGCAEPQDVPDVAQSRLQRTRQRPVDCIVDLTEPAQDGGDQATGEGTVALAQSGKPAVRGERVVEGPLPGENVAEEIEGRGPCGDAGRALFGSL